MKSYYLN
jgi:hypothetical protein